MKKTILAFGAGQALQLVILAVALHITYADNTMLFCIIGGVAATVILGTGVVLDRIELAVKENEMDETAPLPKEIKVTNDKVEKESDAPAEGPKSGSNAQHTPKHIKLTVENPSSLMEKALAEVQNG